MAQLTPTVLYLAWFYHVVKEIKMCIYELQFILPYTSERPRGKTRSVWIVPKAASKKQGQLV